jgi:transposase
MSRKSLWVGLDIGADEMIACGTDDQGSVLFEHLLPTTAGALDVLLKKDKRPIKLIGLEAGSFGIVLTRALRKFSYRVVVLFNARQCSKFLAIRRNKTDKNDARGLADIARLGRASISEVRVSLSKSNRGCHLQLSLRGDGEHSRRTALGSFWT